MALIVKKSKLPGCGKGLFTTKAIKKDSKVIEYRGEKIGYTEFRRRARNEVDQYIFFVRMGLSIDSMHTPQYKARYANDARGFVRVKGLKNNSEFIIYGDKVFVVASRDIKAGEEIYVDYTEHYWKDMKKRRRN